jgi:hypothetical protein
MNRYADMLPKSGVDNRQAAQSLNLFAEAIVERIGGDVEVNLSYSLPIGDKVEIRCTFYVPSATYSEYLFVAWSEGANGFPVNFSPYGGEPKICRDQAELDDCLADFAKLDTFVKFFSYMERHTRKKRG